MKVAATSDIRSAGACSAHVTSDSWRFATAAGQGAPSHRPRASTARSTREVLGGLNGLARPRRAKAWGGSIRSVELREPGPERAAVIVRRCQETRPRRGLEKGPVPWVPVSVANQGIEDEEAGEHLEGGQRLIGCGRRSYSSQDVLNRTQGVPAFGAHESGPRGQIDVAFVSLDLRQVGRSGVEVEVSCDVPRHQPGLSVVARVPAVRRRESEQGSKPRHRHLCTVSQGAFVAATGSLPRFPEPVLAPGCCWTLGEPTLVRVATALFDPDDGPTCDVDDVIVAEVHSRTLAGVWVGSDHACRRGRPVWGRHRREPGARLGWHA